MQVIVNITDMVSSALWFSVRLGMAALHQVSYGTHRAKRSK